MTLFSSIGRRGRGRRRGRRFNAERNMNVRAIGYATCTNFGRCYGAVTDFPGTTNSSLSAVPVYNPDVNNRVNGNVYDVTLKNIPIPDIYVRNSVLAYAGAFFRPLDLSSDWIQYPSSYTKVERRRDLRFIRIVSTAYYARICLLPGSTTAESNYRIFVRDSRLSNHDNLAKTYSQLQARDFRGSIGAGVNNLFARDPRQPYSNVHGKVGWWGIWKNNGYLKITLPHFDESVQSIFRVSW